MSDRLPPLPMDHAEAREAGRKLLVIDEAGLLNAFRRAFKEALQSRGCYHDGTQYHPLQQSEARENENRIRQMREDGTIGYHFPVVGWLGEFLGVAKEQADAIAVELEIVTQRSVALQLIDQFHRQARQILARRNAGRRTA